MTEATGLATGFTDLPGSVDAALALKQQLWQPELQLVLTFCSPEYRESGFAEAVKAAFGDVPVIGCTTSGEVTPNGYQNNGIAAFSFAAPDFFVEIGRFAGLQEIDIAGCSEEAGKRLLALEARTEDEEQPDEGASTLSYRTIGLVLIDALSQREEAVMSCLDNALGSIPLFGASAGDGLRFEKTSVLVDGAFESDGAVLAFDCVLRRLELEHMQQLQRIPPIFTRHRVTGFSTFGEQFASMHVNQTFTGLAIGKRRSA